MRKKLYVDGVDLSTYGVYITGTGTFGAPSRKLELTDVPGRNGALVGIDKSYSNISVSYPCFIYASLETNMANLRAFLLSRSGYVKITEDYHTGEYRLGIYEGPFTPTIQKTGDAGSFTLTFDCMPQRFLDSGDTIITGLRNGGTVSNPTRFNALPVIYLKKVLGGPFTVNGVTLTLYSGGGKNITIDCANMECFDTDDGTSFNDKLESATFEFPYLSPGTNTISSSLTFNEFDGDLKIQPRWWTL